MCALLIIGCTVGGAAIGGIAGIILGLREGGDINLAPAFYAPAGAAIGAVGGCVIGAVVFA